MVQCLAAPHPTAQETEKRPNEQGQQKKMGQQYSMMQCSAHLDPTVQGAARQLIDQGGEKKLGETYSTVPAAVTPILLHHSLFLEIRRGVPRSDLRRVLPAAETAHPPCCLSHVAGWPLSATQPPSHALSEGHGCVSAPPPSPSSAPSVARGPTAHAERAAPA